MYDINTAIKYMNINATILVQAINFAIVYLIIRFLICRPAIAVIKGEQTQLSTLHARIGYNQQYIETKEQERLQERRKFVDYCFLHQPELFFEYNSAIKKNALVQYVPLSEKEINECSIQIARDVAKKIEETV